MDTPVEESVPDLSSLKIEDNSRGSRRITGRKVLFVALLVAIISAAGILLYLFAAPKPVVEVTVARPAGDARSGAVLNASGYVTPRRRATVAAKITGRVIGLYVDEGMRVTSGQVLAVLDDSDTRVRLSSAQADRDASKAAIADLEVRLANAERELRRTTALHASGIQTEQALDQAQTTERSLRAQIDLAKSQVQAAEARIAVAQQDLDNSIIRTPFSGIVVSKDAQIGEMVSPVSAGGGYTRTGIATIVDMESLEVEVDVNESYIARVQPEQPAIATLDAYPDWQIPARVRTVIPTADRQKATVKVRLSFNKLDPRILPDMGVKVAFLPTEENPQAKENVARAMIPAIAVRKDKDGSYVFLVKETKLERRAVTLGMQQDKDIPVLAGVTAGDTLVLQGAESLREGQAVKVKP